MRGRQGALYCELGQYEQALTLLQESLAVARRLQDKREIAFCLAFMGRTVWWQGAGLTALPLLEESLSIRHMIGDRVGIAATLDTLAAVCNMSADFHRARYFAEQGLAMSREIGHSYRIAHILKTLGSIAFGLGQYDTAILHYQAALATFRQLGDDYGIVTTLAEMGRAMYASGEFPRALFIQVLNEAVIVGRKLGNYHSLYRALGVLGDVCTWIGDYEAGERCGQELVELSRQMPPNFLASCLRLWGEANLGLGKLHLARRYLLEAMAIMVKSETRLLINSQVALLAWANLLCRECTQPEVANHLSYVQRKQAQALEIISSLLHESKARPMHKARAAQFAAELGALLPSGVAAAAKAHGKAKTLVQIISEIVCQEQTGGGQLPNFISVTTRSHYDQEWPYYSEAKQRD